MLLQAVDLRFTYGEAPVINGVSLSIPAGRILGILGPNGSGKSTLLKLLAGTLTPASGQVIFDGVDLRARARQRIAQRLAVVPQDTHLAFDYSVIEIVLMGRYPHLGALQIEGPEDLRIARRALEATGTAALERRPFMTLSGGERQRVVIASALAQIEKTQDERRKTQELETQDSALLLDEPTAALDLGYQLDISALLVHLNSGGDPPPPLKASEGRRSIGEGGCTPPGVAPASAKAAAPAGGAPSPRAALSRPARALTIVIATHDLAFASAVCHELVLLRDGRVLEAGPVDRVLTSSNIKALYDVEADVRRDDASGRMVVVPRRHLR